MLLFNTYLAEPLTKRSIFFGGMMKFDRLKNSKECLPAAPGEYEVYNHFMGDYIPVSWSGSHWYWLNGEPVPMNIVLFWR